jgi:hypothetical protein
MSLWTDTWCNIDQCGAFPGAVPVGAALFPPSQDHAFSQSAGGMIWPRGFVGAAAFWSFNASEDSQSPDFVNAVWALNDAVANAGGLVCPSTCECTQVAACGVPYIPAPPPPVGVLGMATCKSTIGLDQKWTFSGGSAGMLVNGNASLCVFDDGGAGSYPLYVNPCSAEAANWTWAGPPAPAHIVSSATGDCMDIRLSDLLVGTYECGSGSGLNQTNQDWAPNGDGSISGGTGNLCLTLLPSP